MSAKKVSKDTVLSIDAGTQSIRIALIDFKGNILKIAKTEIEPFYSKNPGWAEQDPEYFYNILPYTYALGVSDKWIKKFESIAMQPPRWYNGTEVWSYVLFDRMLRDTLRAANDSMVSQPGGKAGSFVSGGGGFTGGGVGGGGGGSW